MDQKLAWGILGAGAIAKAFASALKTSATGRLAAVGSRSREKAEAFSREFAAPLAFGSYEELLASPEVQAVYIATPHPQHAQWAIRAAEAGKHILCEKPAAANAAEAEAMIEAAREHKVFFMEAFMYRCHPQTAKLAELVRSGVIGQVRMIQATFSFHAGFNPESRLFKNDLAGGGILDVGCYAVSMSRLIAGAALGRDFADPLAVRGAGHLGATGVDEWAAAVLQFPDDIVAQVATGVALNQENVVRVFGSDGRIVVPNPWVANRGEAESPQITVHVKGEKEPRVVTTESAVTSFALEADTAARAIAAGRLEAPPPAMTPADTLGNLRALDAWRQSIGLTYAMETPPRRTMPVHGRPLAVRSDAIIPRGALAGLAKSVSRLVMGVDNITTAPHIHVLFDDFFERGGNAFDTAYIYGGGACDKALGWWIRNRGVRDQVVVVGKGAHTPNCDPASLTRQLLESLERLQTDHVDIYLMHRDNPAIPAGEFVDVLNEHVRAGRIRIFGGSNWTPRRMDEANDYARRMGLQGMGILSNNFSLARMVNPVWAGCELSSDPATRAWLAERRIASLSWSSQARGFFTPRADPPAEAQPDKELARCWYSDDNFRRRERAMALAKRLGCDAIHVALAYVLAQPFASYALIGPRSLGELHSSLQALKLRLTPAHLKWLNLESDIEP